MGEQTGATFLQFGTLFCCELSVIQTAGSRLNAYGMCIRLTHTHTLVKLNLVMCSNT